MDPERPRPRVGPFLTQRGIGEVDGYRWSLHCDVKADGVYDYLYIDDVVGHTGGQGGGGIGDPGATVLHDRQQGHIVTTGGHDSGLGLAKPGERLQPNAVDGLVSGPVARVLVELSDGTSEDATLMPHADNDNLQSFVLVFPSGLKANAITAFDSDGNEVDRALNEGDRGTL